MWMKTVHILTFSSLNSCITETDGFHLYRATPYAGKQLPPLGFPEQLLTLQLDLPRHQSEDVKIKNQPDKQINNSPTNKTLVWLQITQEIFGPNRGILKAEKRAEEEGSYIGHPFHLPVCVFLALSSMPLGYTGLYTHWHPQVASPHVTSGLKLQGLGMGEGVILFPGVFVAEKLFSIFKGVSGMLLNNSLSPAVDVYKT